MKHSAPLDFTAAIKANDARILAERQRRQRLTNISIFVLLAAIAALSLPMAAQKVLAKEQTLKWEARI